jgi:hypothetical protein
VSAADVLSTAADEIGAWPQWRADREFRHGAGGELFSYLIELGGRLYGPTAVGMVERQLRGELAHGQLQHWQACDRTVVVATLRAAARAAVSAGC